MPIEFFLCFNKIDQKDFFMAFPEQGQALRWKMEEIDFQSVNTALIRDDELLFYMLASASFVEILSDRYSHNLIEHFSDDAAVVSWLEQHWQREEMQHGRALKAYVQAVWPEFDWERAHQDFIVEYGALCTTQQLEPGRALEMVARCVVETGTATFYRALHAYAKEPVLLALLANIQADETNHYLHFRDFFDAYNVKAQYRAWPVIKAIWRRVTEIRSEDSYIAFKHVYCGRHPGARFHQGQWQRYSKQIRRHARHYYPYTMAFKMLIKPIPMAQPIKNILQWLLVGGARLMSRV